MPTSRARPPRRLAPLEVRHLAFEGGGAKGLAFIGALAALEALEIHPPSGGRGSLLGISGASAGSMTGFLYAMGYKPSDLIRIQLAKDAFTRFFERPRPNVVRTITRVGYMGGGPMLRFVGAKRRPLTVVPEHLERRLNDIRLFPFDSRLNNAPALVKAGGIPDAFIDGIQELILNNLKGLKQSKPDLAPIIDKLTASRSDLHEYAYSLLFDLGLFTGLEVRDFLREQLAPFLQAKNRSYLDADKLSLAQFASLTGLNLAFAAVNATTGQGQYFRGSPARTTGDDTPEFPVLDAVAISSAYPLAFKPYVIVGRNDVANGYWLDGGVQNNLPLHAFDTAPDLPLARGMLGIRLETAPEPYQVVSDIAGYLDLSLLGFLLKYVGDIADTALFPTEGGQIRTPQENAQTIKIVIPSSLLSTLNFSPARANVREAILVAFDSVADYFVPGFVAQPPPGSPASPAGDALRVARQRLAANLDTA
jgi:predicted acylesterase/phospholipase RssA